jgi:hypothetical protein
LAGLLGVVGRPHRDPGELGGFGGVGREVIDGWGQVPGHALGRRWIEDHPVAERGRRLDGPPHYRLGDLEVRYQD